jgi:hypothetical protein
MLHSKELIDVLAAAFLLAAGFEAPSEMVAEAYASNFAERQSAAGRKALTVV